MKFKKREITGGEWEKKKFGIGKNSQDRKYVKKGWYPYEESRLKIYAVDIARSLEIV